MDVGAIRDQTENDALGLGGIGSEVGRLCAALGMRVVGSRRSAGGELSPGFSEIGVPADLDRFLPHSDVVAICCQWTPETTNVPAIRSCHAWRRNDLVIWDNRTTMHRVTRFDETRVRDMRRTTVAGDSMTVEQLAA